jgi:hypothetical protein
VPPAAIAPVHQKNVAKDGPSASTAVLSAVATTTVGYGLFAAGAASESAALMVPGGIVAVVGPSVGYFYVGESGRGTVHTAIRAGGAAMAGAGLTIVAVQAAGCILTFDSSSCENTGGEILLAAGTVIVVADTVYSLIDTPFAVRREKERRRDLTIIPTPIQGPDRSVGMGLAAAATF